ncbi:MAG: DUF5320 domain-containing protein [Syntrophomonadaceae bacterium]|jgi:hypothetical protein|nr:DUF5320 domain-containing protein [Syntrophomonadaceae bacterium]
MPRFDGTGPTGRGRMTGRGMGRCRTVNDSGGFAGQNEPSSGDQATGPVQGLVRRIGRGLGMGQGRGSGRGRFGGGQNGR